MRRAFCVFLCLLSFSGVVTGARAAEAPVPAQVVERLHAALLTNMKDGARVAFDERVKRLAPVVDAAFDLPSMARISVGAGWQQLSAAERESLVDAFSNWTVATYAAQFKNWDGESFVLTGQGDPSKSDVLVNTEIRTAAGKATVLNYRLRRQAGASWRIIDIYLDGAVSQLALRRADFAAVFGKGGAAALSAHLRDLTDKLRAAG